MTSGVSLSLLSCWTALLASICACLLSRLPTRKEKGKCYLKRMLATPSEYITCSFACPVSYSASVQPHFALFNCFSSSCLALLLAPSLEPDFSLFMVSSCLALSLAPSLEPDFSLFMVSSCLALSLAPSLEPDFSLFKLFLELLLVALARAFFEAFPACVDSLQYPFRISMDHKYSLRARLSNYL